MENPYRKFFIEGHLCTHDILMFETALFVLPGREVTNLQESQTIIQERSQLVVEKLYLSDRSLGDAVSGMAMSENM